MTTPRILTVSELAGHLNVHRITVYRLLKNGTLPGFKIGRVWRFDLAEITLWMQTESASASCAKRFPLSTDGHRTQPGPDRKPSGQPRKRPDNNRRKR